MNEKTCSNCDAGETCHDNIEDIHCNIADTSMGADDVCQDWEPEDSN